MANKRITDLIAAGTLTGDELVEVSQESATVTITGTTISALASDNSYNDSADGFVAAGFTVGDRVRVRGFTGNAANNIVAAVVTAVTTGKLTIGGADGNVIVDDAAGESVAISKWLSRKTSLDDIVALASGGVSDGDKGDITVSSGGTVWDIDAAALITSFTVALSDLTTALTTGAAKETIRMPYAFTLTEVRAYLATAQASGSILTVDINEGGSTILSTKLTIDNTEKTSTTAAAAAVISDASLADDAEITFDIDQVGSGGLGLKVVLIGYKT